ncbi:MAG: hypothetical protein IPP14_15830 [Planctomycetes bacterium]|nr:hypothetical protein [Planctomycetota bacterium]
MAFRAHKWLNRKGLYYLLMLAAFVVLPGCSLNKEYVKADEDTANVIIPAHEKYVDADTTLDADAKARRKRLLESWRERINAAKGN